MVKLISLLFNQEMIITQMKTFYSCNRKVININERIHKEQSVTGEENHLALFKHSSLPVSYSFQMLNARSPFNMKNSRLVNLERIFHTRSGCKEKVYNSDIYDIPLMLKNTHQQHTHQTMYSTANYTCIQQVLCFKRHKIYSLLR